MENVQENTVSIVPGRWSAQSAAWIATAIPQHVLPDIQAQVESGARLFDVMSGRRQVGAFVLRIDSAPSGDDGVIVAAGGHLPGFDFTVDLLPHIETLFKGVKAIRIHTARPGLAKKLARQGYDLTELVFRKCTRNTAGDN